MRFELLRVLGRVQGLNWKKKYGNLCFVECRHKNNNSNTIQYNTKWQIKGKDLFAKSTWKELGHKSLPESLTNLENAKLYADEEKLKRLAAV